MASKHSARALIVADRVAVVAVAAVNPPLKALVPALTISLARAKLCGARRIVVDASLPLWWQ
jgi:hypothetical protein